MPAVSNNSKEPSAVSFRCTGPHLLLPSLTRLQCYDSLLTQRPPPGCLNVNNMPFNGAPRAPGASRQSFGPGGTYDPREAAFPGLSSLFFCFCLTFSHLSSFSSLCKFNKLDVLTEQNKRHATARLLKKEKNTKKFGKKLAVSPGRTYHFSSSPLSSYPSFSPSISGVFSDPCLVHSYNHKNGTHTGTHTK